MILRKIRQTELLLWRDSAQTPADVRAQVPEQPKLAAAAVAAAAAAGGGPAAPLSEGQEAPGEGARESSDWVPQGLQGAPAAAGQGVDARLVPNSRDRMNAVYRQVQALDGGQGLARQQMAAWGCMVCKVEVSPC